jgi:TldD protein
MPPVSRRHFLIALGASAPALRLWAQDRNDDVVLRAMRDELERSRQLRVVGGSGDEIPYFISYILSDIDSFTVSASFGAVNSATRTRYRFPVIEVRVGSYDFDNTGHIFSGLYTGSRYDVEALPLDDNYLSLREGFWLGTDHAYKAAVESIARKRAALNSATVSTDKLPDFSKADPVTSLGKIAAPKIEEAGWTARVAKLSGIFSAYPEVLASGVELHLNQGPTYLVNTEATAVRYPDDVIWCYAKAEGQAGDGMVIRDGISVQALEAAQFPPEAELQKAITAMGEHVKALSLASAAEAMFSGPVLFEPQAAAQLLAQLLGDNVRLPRKPVAEPGRNVNFFPSEFEGRIGGRVLPDWMDVIDDPTQTAWQGKPLIGSYVFDFEGVKPSAVSLIEKGVLRRYLTTRQPIKNSPPSNGHARLPGPYGTKTAAIGNLFVKAGQTAPLADLKTRLIQLCKDRDKPYGMLVRKLDFPFSADNGEVQALSAASMQSGGSARPVSPPVLIYRVYPDGREELVRGLRFRGVSSRSLRDILAASTETTLFDYVNNGAPLARLGAGGFLAPAAVIAPGLLFEEMELERAQDQLQKPAIVPPPST